MLQESDKDDFYHNSIKDICRNYNINYHIEKPWFIDASEPFHKYGVGRDIVPLNLNSDISINDIFLPGNESIYRDFNNWSLHPSPVYHRKIANHFYNCITSHSSNESL